MKKPNPPKDLWAQMDAISGIQIEDDPGISIQEYADRYRVTYKNAHEKLHKLLRDGKVIRGYKKSAGNGRRMQVFRPA